ncbi:MAG: UDP-N-acetylmuramate dehydrogenase [Bacillota bacterium]|nr:UDP-N-acetylmuramate dehydrogenase [Bacillota bacterium]
MTYKEIRKILKKGVSSKWIYANEPMQKHTTFRVGGSADIFVTPQNVDEIAFINQACAENGIPLLVIGNGSNLLVQDGGIRGVVMQLGRNFSHTEIEGKTVRVQSGALLLSLCETVNKYGLTGMEFAYGIPGTVGGAVAMNAGAFGGEMRDIVAGVAVMDKYGRVRSMDNEALQFSYRTSIIQKNEGNIILDAILQLKRGAGSREKELMAYYMNRRREKQPLKHPSAGSVFKRPEGHFAGTLIEQAGLKGFRIGDAQVSPLHAGFIVNVRKAKASDILALMGKIQETVYNKSGIMLQPEIRVVGER